MKKFVYSIGTSLLICVMFMQCSSKLTKLPPTVSKLADVFYSENQNQQLIYLSDSLSKLPLTKDERYINTLFKAAALSESEKINQAFALVNTLEQPTNELKKFWYESIKGLILFRKKDYNQAYEILLKTTFYSHPDKVALALNERILARISLNLDDYETGLNWLQLSSKHFRECELNKSLAINYKLLGRHYMNVKNYSEALRNFKEAEKLLLTCNDRKELFYIYVNLTDYYLQTKELKNAQLYAEKYLPRFEDVYDNQMRTLTYNNQGEIEYQLKNYQKAAGMFRKTVDIPTDYVSADSRKMNALVNLASINRVTGDNMNALYYVTQARVLLTKNMPYCLRYKVYNEYAHIYHSLHWADLSYQYLDSAKMQIDSINLSESKTTKAFFDSKIKISALSTHLQQAKEREKRVKITLSLVVIVFSVLLVLAIIIYQLQQTKTKALKSLVLKNLQVIADERKLNEVMNEDLQIKKNKRITHTDKSDELYLKIINWLETDKKFMRNDLTLELVAKELNTNREYVSRAMSNRDIRFNDLINKYRIQETIQILSDKNNIVRCHKLSVIANAVGFNSDSVFIEAFRKQTGMTPAQFRNNIDLPQN
ncbi:MAG: helix-turn-helix domain-containing protein [Paludibacter sp.]